MATARPSSADLDPPGGVSADNAAARFAAAVAHDINSPIQFIGDSATFLAAAQDDLNRLRAAYARALAATRLRVPASIQAELDELEGAIDVHYLERRIPKALERIQIGVQRLASIARSARLFAEARDETLRAVDINGAARTAVAAARDLVAGSVAIEEELSPLPLVCCHEAAVRRVLTDLLGIAARVAAAAGNDDSAIRISSRSDDGHVVFTIEHANPPAGTASSIQIGETAGGFAAACDRVSLCADLLEACGGRLDTTDDASTTTHSVRVPVTPAEANWPATGRIA